MEMLFYLCTILFIIFEMVQYTYANRLVYYRANKDKIIKSKNMISYSLVGILYLIWILIGLMISQYKIFLAILILSFIPKSKFGAAYIKLDAFITIGLLVFMLLNKFQWHLI